MAIKSVTAPRLSRVVLTGDITNNNAVANTLADVTGLAFTVEAGVEYAFRFVVKYTSAATTTGSRWTLNGPALTALYGRSQYTLAATTITTNHFSAYGVPAAANASSLTAGNLAVIEGTIACSAAGDVQLRFASEIASSAIVAKAGSYVDYGPLI